jgi:hypothetical protein
MSADLAISARDRAFELAKTGEHASWPSIVAALTKEGYRASTIIAIGSDLTARAHIADLILASRGDLRI